MMNTENTACLLYTSHIPQSGEHLAGIRYRRHLFVIDHLQNQQIQRCCSCHLITDQTLSLEINAVSYTHLDVYKRQAYLPCIPQLQS